MPGSIEQKLKKHKTEILILVLALAVLDAVVWRQILFSANRDLRVYFLDVGQGDSELIVLPGGPPAGGAGVQMLVDGGPVDGRVLSALGDVLAPT
ncbi:MAG: hypothetical protein AAB601_01985, partial [Patescibacteria group bacterium]